MTLTYGFFNSNNGDRVYDAEDFSSFYDGLIFDGVYSAVGNRFMVEAATDMYITVDSGRAWFNHTWTYNSSKIMLEVPDADTVYGRIDAVVLEVNKQQRKNFIKIVEGTPDSDPEKPELTVDDENEIYQHALAYITVEANATEISDEDIEFVVDTQETPLASGLNLIGLPSGGTKGQVLAKASNTSGVVGWYNVGHLPSDTWYLPYGIQESNVIAAFVFINRPSMEYALESVHDGIEYTLLRSSTNITWNTDTGFYIPGTKGAGLRSTDIASIAANVKSAAFRFSGALVNPSSKVQGGILLSNARFLALNAWRPNTVYYDKLGMPKKIGDASWRIASGSLTEGVYGINFNTESNKVYSNGTQLSTSSSSDSATNLSIANPAVIGQLNHNPSGSDSYIDFNGTTGFRVQAVVLYDCELTDAQHLELANAMNEL